MKTYCIAQGTLMHCGDLNGKEVQKRGDIYIYIYISDSLCYTTETNTAFIVKQLHANKNSNSLMS